MRHFSYSYGAKIYNPDKEFYPQTTVAELPDDKTARYYEEVLRNLSDLMVLLKENNVMLKELVTAIREDHKTNLGIQDNLRKIRFNTQ